MTPRGQRARALAILALGAMLLLAGCGPATSSVRVGVGVGDTAPPLSGMTLDGRTVSLSDFRGKPVVVTFWASWCVPCQDEFPLFRDAEAKHPDLVILGVVFNDDEGAARGFAAQMHADWASVTDASGALASAYLVAFPPQSYFIDRTGVVRSRQFGEVTAPDFERQFAAISP